VSGAIASALSINRSGLNTSNKYFYLQMQGDGGQSGGQTAYNASVTDINENIYTAGWAQNSSGGTYTSISKFNKDGNLVWTRSLADTNVAANQSTLPAYSIKIDPHNTSLIVGINFLNTSGGTYTSYVRYTLDGTLVFQRQLTNPTATVPAASAFDLGSTVHINSDNTYCTFGSSTDANGFYRGIMTKSSMTNGAVTFHRYFTDNSGNSAAEFFDGSCDSSGNIYAVGIALSSGGGSAGLIVKYSSTGTFQWAYNILDSRGLAFNADIRATNIEINKDILYISGMFSNPNDPQDQRCFILKMDTTGNVLSYKTFRNYVGVPTNPFPLNVIDMAFDLKDNFYALSSSGIVLKFNTSLNLLASSKAYFTTYSMSTTQNNDIIIVGNDYEYGFGIYGFALLLKTNMSKIFDEITLSGSYKFFNSYPNIYETNDTITLVSGDGTDSAGIHTNAAGTLTTGSAPTLGVFTNTEYK
jgi:hypothetical protein